MAIEDNLDQLYGLHLANTIMCSRMWRYLAEAFAKQGGSAEDFLQRHAKMSLDSADLWEIEGPRSELIRDAAKDAIRAGFSGTVKAAGLSDRLQ